MTTEQNAMAWQRKAMPYDKLAKLGASKLTIANTIYPNNKEGWSMLLEDIQAQSLTIKELHDICAWNDRNGSWDAYDMMEEGLEVHDIYATYVAAIIEWSEDVQG